MNAEQTTLMEQYPQYFGLDASDGLDVYVWQMAETSYSFGLLPHSQQGRDWISRELLDLRGTRAAQMRAILSTYNLNEKDIYVIPWQNPLSSYISDWQIVTDDEDIDAKRQAYIESIRQMLNIEYNEVYAPTGTKSAYTYEELSEMPADELLALFVQNGLVIHDDLKRAYTEEELEALFKGHFDMWHLGLSELSHTMYLDLAQQTKAIYDRIAE